MYSQYIDSMGNYYVGDRAADDHIEVTERPSELYDWNGLEWVLNSDRYTAKLEAAVDAHIDSVARADKWDSRITCVMRAGYPNPWQARAVAFGEWMDSCYAYCYQVQTDAAAGLRTIPTEAELIAELPVMVWPT